MIRKVQKIFPGRPTLEGAGVHLRRGFGNGQEKLFDPFLMFDDFRGDEPSQFEAGFPWHPHRGIETITYLIQGEVDHGDSMGNAGTIGPGDVQWMTAGSGLIHQEMPRGDASGRMGGFQLWANLPAAAQNDGTALPRDHRRGNPGGENARRARSGSSAAASAEPSAPFAISSSNRSIST